MNRELKAFVGLSSNLAFNEDVTDKGNPNPILEGPIGLCLFYDEIWFLDESLCPLNMRDLDYVKFVNKVDLPEINFGAEKIFFPEKRVKNLYVFLEKSPQMKIGKLSQYGPEISELRRTAGSQEGVNRIIDEKIASYLGCDLVINSCSPIYTDLGAPAEIKSSQGSLASLITQSFLCKIPILQLPEGPYIKKVDELRENMQRGAFQDKIKTFDDCKSSVSVKDAKEQLLNELADWTLQLMHEAVDPNQPYKIAVDVIAGNTPILGNIYTCAQAGWNYYEYRGQKKYEWAVFLGDFLNKFRN
jgi:hypothetical protein